MESLKCCSILLIALAFFCSAKTCLSTRVIEPNLKSSTTTSNDFIRTSCGVTMYPEICYRTLSVFAGTIQKHPTQLANAALNVTLDGAQATTNMVLKLLKSRNLKPREAGAIRDCVENMKDSVDELHQSLIAMRSLDSPEFEVQMSNIQTWVSAALTYEDTCMDGFEGNSMNGKVKDTVRSYIVRLAQLTSNALALINKLS